MNWSPTQIQYPLSTMHSYYNTYYWLYSLCCILNRHDFTTTNLYFLIPSPFTPSPPHRSSLWQPFVISICFNFVCLSYSFCSANFFLVWCSLICLFFLCFPCLRMYIRKKNVAKRNVSLLPMFPSRSFTVSGLTFKSFGLILVCGIRRWSSFIFARICPTFPTPFIEQTVFTLLYPPVSFVKY